MSNPFLRIEDLRSGDKPFKQIVAELARDGLTRTQAAQKIGMHPRYFTKTCKRLGLDHHFELSPKVRLLEREHGKSLAEMVAQMAREGVSRHEVSKRLGLSSDYFYQLCAQLGLDGLFGGLTPKIAALEDEYDELCERKPLTSDMGKVSGFGVDYKRTCFIIVVCLNT